MVVMFRKIQLLIALCLTAAAVNAQSGRNGSAGYLDPETEAISKQPVSDLFSKATNYHLERFTELEAQKAPYSEAVHREILQEQKQLAAKYAAQISTREGLNGEDYYYLGRLLWLSANKIKAREAFARYLSVPSRENKRRQTARSVTVVIDAEAGDFESAEAMLAEYLESRPVTTSQVQKMRKQLAVSYRESGKLVPASHHADAAFEATKSLLFELSSRARALDQLLDSGITAFDIHKELRRQKEAEETLEILRKYGATMKSHAVYYRAVDEHIVYLIETNRRQEALRMYGKSFKTLESEIENKSVRAAVVRKLSKRKTHYEILGEAAPEFGSIEAYIPEKPVTLAGLKGKVVLLDFWATWCGPCFDAFPKLTKWHETLGGKGLVIIGVTRYYGEAGDRQVNKQGELAFLRNFKVEQNLPYQFVVAGNQTNQIRYGAMSLPTAVLIGRDGRVRYIATGTSDSRETEIEKKILELLQE